MKLLHPTVVLPSAASVVVKAEEVLEPKPMPTLKSQRLQIQLGQTYGQGLLQMPRVLSATWGLGVRYSPLGNPLSAHPFLLSWRWEGNSRETGQAVIIAKVTDSGQLMMVAGCSQHYLFYQGLMSMLLLLLPVWRTGAGRQKSPKSSGLLLPPAVNSRGREPSSGVAKLCSAHTALRQCRVKGVT